MPWKPATREVEGWGASLGEGEGLRVLLTRGTQAPKPHCLS